jgi:rod shape-determining protein MreB
MISTTAATEVAVISLRHRRFAIAPRRRPGWTRRSSIIKREYKLLIGQQTTENQTRIGSAYDMREELRAEVRGRDMLTVPRDRRPEARRSRGPRRTGAADHRSVKSTLDKTPPELAADIMDRGIVMAGGGALLTNFDERLRHETQMPVHLAESPLTCVAVGSGRSLEEFEAIHRSAKARRNNHRRYSS